MDNNYSHPSVSHAHSHPVSHGHPYPHPSGPSHPHPSGPSHPHPYSGRHSVSHGGSAGGSGQSQGGRGGDLPSEINGLLSTLRDKISALSRENTHLKSTNDELEAKLHHQAHELSLFQVHLTELERVVNVSFKQGIVKRTPLVMPAVGSAPPPMALAPSPSVPKNTMRSNPSRISGPDWFANLRNEFAQKMTIELVHSFDGDSIVCSVKFSRDGLLFATGCNRVSRVFQVVDGTLTAELTDSDPNDGDLYIRTIAFSPDSTKLATGAEDHIVRVWDLKSKTILVKCIGHAQDIYSLDWISDHELVSGSGDKSCKIWQVPSGKCMATLINEDYTSLALSSAPKESGVTSISLGFNGRAMLTGSLDSLVRLWDLSSGTLLELFEGHSDSVYSVAFSPNGKSIVSGALDKLVKVWDISDHSILILENKAQFKSVKVNSTFRHSFTGHSDYVLSVAFPLFFPEMECVLSASKDRNVTLWDASSHSASGPLLTLTGHKNSVISISTSKNGLFGTGSGDLRARIWRVSKVEEEEEEEEEVLQTGTVSKS